MARLKPVLRSTKSDLDALPVSEGQMIVLKDDEEIHIDVNSLTRKRVTGKSTVVTGNSATIEMSGDGSAENPLKAELVTGAGTANEPFLIYTVDNLIRLRDEVNAGDSKIGKYYKLMNDLDLQGNEYNQWTPIGGVDYKAFRGTFDGNGHKIKNVYINNINRDYAGLFGLLENGTIRRLGVENAYIIAGSTVGALVGNVSSMAHVTNCYATGHVKGYYTVGGLAGNLHFAEINKCYSHSSVEASEGNIGGLLGGAIASVVSQCYSAGRVICTGVFVGGLIGQITSSGEYTNTIEKCYYDNQTSGITIGVGLGNQTGVEGKTTAQMKLIATYVGWDFINTWQISLAIGDGYPSFQFINEGESQGGCSCLPYGFQKTEKVEISGGVATIDLGKEDVSIFIVTVNANLIIAISLPSISESYFRTFEIHVVIPGGGTRPPVITFPYMSWVDGVPVLEGGKTNVIIVRTDGSYIDTGSMMTVNYLANLAYTY